MNNDCRGFRASHLEDLAALSAYAADPKPAGHALECRVCARWAQGSALHARVLRGLARLPAPSALDGWTVAALHAGLRQERAAEAVAGLSREVAPKPEVTLFTDGTMPRLHAPAELDLRVARELAAPAEMLLSRHLGRLPRVAAPPALEARVQADLQRSSPAARRPQPRARRFALAAAASLLFLAASYATGSWLVRTTVRGAEEAGGRLRATLLPTPADASDALRSLLPGVEGSIPVEALAAPRSGSRPLKVPATSNTRTAPSIPAAPPANQLPPPAAHPLLEELVMAPTSVRYSGERVVEAVSQADGGRTWSHRERVHSLGNGQFAIEPLDLLHPALAQRHAQTFLLQQQRRQGLNYRYRDFHIHDLELFLANYTAVDSGNKVFVAGRECAEFLVEKVALGERRYTIAVDLEHGLVLRYREEKLDGALVAQMHFTAVDFAPDLSQVSWHVARNDEQLLSRDDGLAQILGFEPILPRTLPPGYRLVEQAVVKDDAGQAWLKSTYGDGVERLFFVHGGPLAPGAPADKWPDPDRVEVLDAAPWTSAQGNLSGERVIALGKVSPDELLIVLDSSRP